MAASKLSLAAHKTVPRRCRSRCRHSQLLLAALAAGEAPRHQPWTLFHPRSISTCPPRSTCRPAPEPPACRPSWRSAAARTRWTCTQQREHRGLLRGSFAGARKRFRDMMGFPWLLLRLSSHPHRWLAAVGISAAAHSLALFCPKHASIHRTFVSDTSNLTPLALPLLCSPGTSPLSLTRFQCNSTTWPPQGHVPVHAVPAVPGPDVKSVERRCWSVVPRLF